MTLPIIICSYFLCGGLFAAACLYFDPPDLEVLEMIFFFWPVFFVCVGIVFISDRYDGWVKKKKRLKKQKTSEQVVIPPRETVMVSCHYGTEDVFYAFTEKHLMLGILKHEHDYKREVIIGEHEKEEAREIWNRLIDEGFVQV